MLSIISYDYLRTLILPLKEIDDHIPKEGKILDLGCGEGVVSRFLAKRSKRVVIGIDKNVKRLPKSNRKNLKFLSADISKVDLSNLDGVVISDVLHHFNFSEQKQLLAKISDKLNSKGLLVIKEIDANEFFRSKLSRLWDFVLYPSDKIYYWKSQELKKYLESINLEVRIEKASRFFPGSTNLLVCKKY